MTRSPGEEEDHFGCCSNEKDSGFRCEGRSIPVAEDHPDNSKRPKTVAVVVPNRDSKPRTAVAVGQ